MWRRCRSLPWNAAYSHQRAFVLTAARTKHFRPLADSIGIFKYEGRFYIETEDQPMEKVDAQPPVHVFLREGAGTRQVCSLQPVSVPVPVD